MKIKSILHFFSFSIRHVTFSLTAINFLVFLPITNINVQGVKFLAFNITSLISLFFRMHKENGLILLLKVTYYLEIVIVTLYGVHFVHFVVVVYNAQVQRQRQYPISGP